MFTIQITDEFNTVFEFKTSNPLEVSKIVKEWVTHIDETPIYNINIEIDPSI